MLFHAFLALAAQSAVADDPQAVAKKAAKPICRTEQTTSSRMGGRRVCKKQAEWDAQAKQAANALDRQRNNRPEVYGNQ